MLKTIAILLLSGLGLSSCSSTANKTKSNSEEKMNGFETQSSKPQITELPKKVATVNFAFDSAKLSEEEMSHIRHTVEVMKLSPPKSVIVVLGHTDQIGTPEYNRKLGLERAQRVKKALISYGLKPETIVARSKGESMPIVNAKSWSQRSVNRRATIKMANSEDFFQNISMK